MATPDQLRALIKQVESAMKEMDSLRGKAEIPVWEKKELKEQRAMARAKKEWAKKELAAQTKPVKKPSAPKTPRGGSLGGGTLGGNFRGPVIK